MISRANVLRTEITRIDGTKPGGGLPKHIKMTTSPFVFFRGSAQLFYRDLKHNFAALPDTLFSIPKTTIVGDCHTSNFGFLTEEGSHGDRVIFSPNDFDDACIGRMHWDLLRFSTSLYLCAEHCRGMVTGAYKSAEKVDVQPLLAEPFVKQQDVAAAVEAFHQGYLSICKLGLTGEQHRDTVLQDSDYPKSIQKRYKKALKRAYEGEHFETKSALAKAVDLSENMLVFKKLPERFQSLEKNQKRDVITAFEPYMDDAVLDVVLRLNAGTGSVNMQRFYFLVGPDNYRGKEDLPLCHIVEVKQQREAAPMHYFKHLNPSNRLNPAHLTAMCQRRMQRRPDLLLDEVQWKRKHWLVRSRHHAKVGIDPMHIGVGELNVQQGCFVEYAELCGKALALAHCRGDRRSTYFEQKVCEVLPDSIKVISESAASYANQVMSDYQWLCQQERKS
jgi:hypothetical protein